MLYKLILLIIISTPFVKASNAYPDFIITTDFEYVNSFGETTEHVGLSLIDESTNGYYLGSKFLLNTGKKFFLLVGANYFTFSPSSLKVSDNDEQEINISGFSGSLGLRYYFNPLHKFNIYIDGSLQREIFNDIDNEIVDDILSYDPLGEGDKGLYSTSICVGLGLNIPVKDKTYISSELSYQFRASNLLPSHNISLNVGVNFAFDF
jgi:hypothetical protein